jgi:hypothetical protein
MLTHGQVMIRDYYLHQFRVDLAAFMPDTTVLYFGHSWASDCDNLNKIPIELRPDFLICLYFTVLVDYAMYTHCRLDYERFAQLIKYPKFCHGLGQFQKNLRELLLVPVQKRMVNKDAMAKELSAGMGLFVDEVVDFFQDYTTHANPAEFFDKLLYDSDVQIPLLIVMINPEMKNDIVCRHMKHYVQQLKRKYERRVNNSKFHRREGKGCGALTRQVFWPA